MIHVNNTKIMLVNITAIFMTSGIGSILKIITIFENIHVILDLLQKKFLIDMSTTLNNK